MLLTISMEHLLPVGLASIGRRWLITPRRCSVWALAGLLNLCILGGCLSGLLERLHALSLSWGLHSLQSHKTC